MIVSPALRTTVAAVLLLAPRVAGAQKVPAPQTGERLSVPLHAYLPSAADLGDGDLPVTEGHGIAWGGDEGYQREFGGEFAEATVRLGTSEFLSITTLVERYRQPSQPRMVLTIIEAMEPRVLGELFMQGAAVEVGEGMLDSLTVTPLDDPALGDASAAFLIAWRASFMQFDMMLLLVARGDLLTVVMALGAPEAGSLSDIMRLAQLIDARIADPTTIPDAAFAPPVNAGPSASKKAVIPEADTTDAPAGGWTEDEVRHTLQEAGVDLEAVAFPPESLLAGAQLVDGGLEPQIDGLGRLSMEFEGTPFFRYGGSELFGLSYHVTVYRDPSVAVLEQLAFDKQLQDTAFIATMMAESAEEMGDVRVAVDAVVAPTVGERASGLRVSMTASVLRFDFTIVGFERGAATLLVMAGGPAGQVREEDLVALSRVLDERVAGLLPGELLVAPEPNRLPALDRMAQAVALARRGTPDSALAAYRAAVAADSGLGRLASPALALCRGGALWNRGAEVLAMCDRAVALADGYLDAHEARGIARAEAGDFAGAVEDLQVSVGWNNSRKARAERRDWIAALERGENPFTDAVLRELRNESLGPF